MSLHTWEATQEVILIEICLVLLAYIRPIFRGKSDALFSRLTICLPLWWFYLSSVWGVITVKNKSLIMISTISVMIEICYGATPMWRLNMLFGPRVMTLCYHIWLFCFCNVLICHCTLAFGYYTLLFCHCILVFFHFDIRKSSFAVVICHFYSVRFIMVYWQGNVQFGMTLRNEFRTR